MRDIQITVQRRAYFDARGRIILNACPGSGKTTCIIYKLSLLEQECRQKFGIHAGIACLSFTNIAKQEILDKYKKAHGQELRHPHHLATIDSFVNQYITLPFYNLLNKNFKRPKVVDEKPIIDRLFQVRYQDKTGKWQDGFVKSLLGFKDQAGKLLCRIYPPSSIWIDKNGDYTFEGKTPNPATVVHATFQEYGKTVFKTKVEKGLITSLDSSFIALHIIKNHEQIGKWLIQRFPFIIIDEAQDNSEIQHAIFERLIELGLANIEMIGDPYQSLYEWRDAKPHLFLQKFTNTDDWTGLPLSQNRRSVQRIIDCFSILRGQSDEIISSVDVQDLAIPVRIYKYTATNSPKIVQHFEETCNAHGFDANHIVVRGNTLKDQMLGNTAAVDPWRTPYPSRLLRIRHHFECNEIKDAVNELRRFILELLNPNADYSTIRDIQKEKESDHTFSGKLYAFLYEIPTTSISFQEWTSVAINELKKAFNIDASGFFEFKKKINGYKMADLKIHNVDLYFKKSASSQYNIPITTIHQVKGATLDAILYFFDENSTGQSVSFNDFKRSDSFPNEKQRMIYVACSRPRQFLALAFPTKITDAALKEKLGEQIEIINL
ncbi:UvrD-helicase domain-containing protein [Parapedobacter deserti]|uniref:DNA 3'-5' helicase n=1 Tax=Parapedobacter deserti TaxID=1912957 RepID=A0ABV7JRV7_9SPHI